MINSNTMLIRVKQNLRAGKVYEEAEMMCRDLEALFLTGLNVLLSSVWTSKKTNIKTFEDTGCTM